MSKIESKAKPKVIDIEEDTDVVQAGEIVSGGHHFESRDCWSKSDLFSLLLIPKQHSYICIRTYGTARIFPTT